MKTEEKKLKKIALGPSHGNFVITQFWMTTCRIICDEKMRKMTKCKAITSKALIGFVIDFMEPLKQKLTGVPEPFSIEVYKVPYNLIFFLTPIFYILVFLPEISVSFPLLPLDILPNSLNIIGKIILLPIFLFPCHIYLSGDRDYFLRGACKHRCRVLELLVKPKPQLFLKFDIFQFSPTDLIVLIRYLYIPAIV